jgi:hypothetical protein
LVCRKWLEFISLVGSFASCLPGINKVGLR